MADDTTITTQKLCHWLIEYANAKGTPINPVKLNHLAILINWWHLAECGALLLHEQVEAWEHGPVLPTIYHEYKGSSPFIPIAHPSRRQPPLEDDCPALPFIQKIFARYNRYTAQQLVRINTRTGAPWGLARKQNGGRRAPIGIQAVQAYFDTITLA